MLEVLKCLGISIGALFLLTLIVAFIAVEVFPRLPAKVKDGMLALVLIYLVFGTVIMVSWSIYNAEVNHVYYDTPPSYSDDDMPWR